MVKSCPSCGFENDDAAKFCKKCGGALNSAPKNENNGNNNSSNNMIIIAILAIICVVVAGAFILLSDMSEDSSDYEDVEDIYDDSSVDESTDSNSGVGDLEIISGTISTGSDISDKTYCKIYVGEQYAYENVKISALYSSGGKDLNDGNIISKTVDSEGYVSVSSAEAFDCYPDYAVITLYDSEGNTLDERGVPLEEESGSQYF